MESVLKDVVAQNFRHAPGRRAVRAVQGAHHHRPDHISPWRAPPMYEGRVAAQSAVAEAIKEAIAKACLRARPVMRRSRGSLGFASSSDGIC